MVSRRPYRQAWTSPSIAAPCSRGYPYQASLEPRISVRCRCCNVSLQACAATRNVTYHPRVAIAQTWTNGANHPKQLSGNRGVEDVTAVAMLTLRNSANNRFATIIYEPLGMVKKLPHSVCGVCILGRYDVEDRGNVVGLATKMAERGGNYLRAGPARRSGRVSPAASHLPG